MELRASAEMRSERGPVREKNEDSLGFLVAPETRPGIDAVYAVADGLGGHERGEVASAMAIATLLRTYGAEGPDGPSASSGPHGASLAETLNGIDQEIAAAGASGEALHRDPLTAGMATTLTAALLVGNSLHLGHVGDSRAYLLRGTRLSQLTEDHSLVADRVRQGLLSADEAARHVQRNVLTQALGEGLPIAPFTAAQPVAPGDTLLLCTDGLHGFLGDRAIADTILGSRPSSAVDALIARAIDAGSNDNVTVLLVSFTAPERTPGR